jgi:hypothetical protein
VRCAESWYLQSSRVPLSKAVVSPLPRDMQVPASNLWWFMGAKWAVANVDHLRQRLREMVSHSDVAAEKGRRARERMVAKYSPDQVGYLLAAEFQRVRKSLQ